MGLRNSVVVVLDSTPIRYARSASQGWTISDPVLVLVSWTQPSHQTFRIITHKLLPSIRRMCRTQRTMLTSSTSKDSWATRQIWQQVRSCKTNRAYQVQRRGIRARFHSQLAVFSDKELTRWTLPKYKAEDLSRRMTSTKTMKLHRVWLLELSILHRKVKSAWIWTLLRM